MGAIFANSRYTGRQVWNRQGTNHDLIDPSNTALGHRDVQRWNTPEDWAISRAPAHPALVTEADFVAAQHIRATREAVPGRTYLLAGLLRCGLCRRRMESCWANRSSGYRCRHGSSSATTPEPGRPRNAYLCEDHVLPRLPALLLRIAAPGGGKPTPASAVEHLRAGGIELSYDAAARTLTADTEGEEKILIG